MGNVSAAKHDDIEIPNYSSAIEQIIGDTQRCQLLENDAQFPHKRILVQFNKVEREIQQLVMHMFTCYGSAKNILFQTNKHVKHYDPEYQRQACYLYVHYYEDAKKNNFFANCVMQDRENFEDAKLCVELHKSELQMQQLTCDMYKYESPYGIHSFYFQMDSMERRYAVLRFSLPTLLKGVEHAMQDTCFVHQMSFLCTTVIQLPYYSVSNEYYGKGSSLLNTKCSQKDLPAVQDLVLQKNVDVNYVHHIWSIPYYDEYRGYLEEECSQSLNTTTFSALYTACSCGNYDIAQLLIQNGANVNYQHLYSNPFTKMVEVNSPLLSACEKQNWKLITLLIDNGATPIVRHSSFKPGGTKFIWEYSNTISKKAKKYVLACVWNKNMRLCKIQAYYDITFLFYKYL